MANQIHLSVVTAEGAVFDRMINYVNIPTAFGSLGILSGHAPMVCAIARGVVKCSDGGANVKIAVGGGVADVNHNQVTLLVSDAKIKNE